jgi:tRNA (guanine-N7-)-methyltransferase
MRVRKHVNPLNFRKEIDNLQLEDIFQNPKLPLHLDIGFAQGEFIIDSATKNREINYIGFEVRQPLAVRVQKRIEEKNLTNAAALYASSTLTLSSLPDNSLDTVTIFFADPWFKKRHHKRRIINAKLFIDIAPKLKKEHLIIFQTDVEPMFDDSVNILRETENIEIITLNKDVKEVNQTGTPSYFEAKCLENKWAIYRTEFRLS